MAVVDADGGLATMDEHGGSVVRYGEPGVTFGFPAWSPDGTRIAAVGDGPTDTAIYVFAVARAGSGGGNSPGTGGTGTGSQPTVVYRSPDRPPFYLYWTPDGRQLSFLTTEPAGIALRVAAADGSGPPASGNGDGVIRVGAPLYFDWVDAGHLLLHVGVGPDAFVGEVGPDGTSLAPAVPGTGIFRSAIVSRDGRYLAYAHSAGESSGEIVVAARDGSTRQPLPVFGPAAFVFDPTGDRLASIARW